MEPRSFERGKQATFSHLLKIPYRLQWNHIYNCGNFLEKPKSLLKNTIFELFK